MVMNTLMRIAPSSPVKTAVTPVAVTLQLAALASVLLCDSNFYSNKKAPFGAWLIFLSYFCSVILFSS